jgi:hypothetical protein
MNHSKVTKLLWGQPPPPAVRRAQPGSQRRQVKQTSDNNGDNKNEF